ncbi:hypothetical protein AAFF_G00424250 [Aldrovandia affinis]|uniref:Uncharacterized protein n=1 Tax=Aldrovandia affinis TaxID=143900 RepID=A0AAD7T6W4_9TELE|nr:hypothetical protein AAFF_G00424250 [Aldrovandia affinis]
MLTGGGEDSGGRAGACDVVTGAAGVTDIDTGPGSPRGCIGEIRGSELSAINKTGFASRLNPRLRQTGCNDRQTVGLIHTLEQCLNRMQTVGLIHTLEQCLNRMQTMGLIHTLEQCLNRM